MSMSLEEFLKVGNAYKIAKNSYSRYIGEEVMTENGISVEWRTGGISGGSCWDEGDRDPHYSIGGDDEPEFKELDSLFEKVCPNITFLQYRNIMSECVSSYDYSINEYYGNHTDYKVKWVCLERLYNMLVEKNLI